MPDEIDMLAEKLASLESIRLHQFFHILPQVKMSVMIILLTGRLENSLKLLNG